MKNNLNSKLTAMKKEFFIEIPTACHENWNVMTPAVQGKYCASCEKTVVDFTTMSDAEIFRIINKNKSGLCGRFDETQLTRPILQPGQPIKKKYWAMLMTALLSISSAFSQVQKKIKPEPKKIEYYSGEKVLGEIVVTGRTVINRDTKQYTIVNEEGMPVPGAVVYIKNLKPLITDSAGQFVTKGSQLHFNISCMGFESVELNTSEIRNDRIVLAKKYNYLEDIQIKCEAGKLMGFMVQNSVITKTSKNKLDSLAIWNSDNKVKNENKLAVYPNPAVGGTSLFLKTPPGKYQVQLVNTEGRMVNVQSVNIENKGIETSITLPSNLATAVYSVRVINLKSRESAVTRVFISNY
jgi:hypothetical protein